MDQVQMEHFRQSEQDLEGQSNANTRYEQLLPPERPKTLLKGQLRTYLPIPSPNEPLAFPSEFKVEQVQPNFWYSNDTA